MAGASPADADFGLTPEDAWGTLGIDGSDPPPARVPTERGDYAGFYAGVAATLRDGALPPVDPGRARGAPDHRRGARARGHLTPPLDDVVDLDDRARPASSTPPSMTIGIRRCPNASNCSFESQISLTRKLPPELKAT